MLTKRQAKDGQQVRIAEEHRTRVLRSCNPGTGKYYGAGGHPIHDTTALCDVGTITSIGPSKQRALVVFPRHEAGLWIDLEALETV